jgi:hypothetical protein
MCATQERVPWLRPWHARTVIHDCEAMKNNHVGLMLEMDED